MKEKILDLINVVFIIVSLCLIQFAPDTTMFTAFQITNLVLMVCFMFLIEPKLKGMTIKKHARKYVFPLFITLLILVTTFVFAR